MSKSDTNSNIQKYVDELIQKEQDKINTLKDQIDDYHPDLVINPNRLVISSDEVIFRFGITRFDRKIPYNSSFEEFSQILKPLMPKNSILFGFKAYDGNIVWIRNDTDLTCAFNYYFARKLPFLHIIPIKTKEAEQLKEFDFSNESNDSENDICIIYSPNEPKHISFFISLPNISRVEGAKYIRSVDQKSTGLAFVDSDGDHFNLENDTEWEYFYTESIRLNQSGEFSILTSKH